MEEYIMKNCMYCKILAIGIIIFFIGACSHPAFAVEDKSSIYENENSINTTAEIYENTNCFIIGSVSEAFNEVFIYGKGDIVFGFEFDEAIHQSEGWIYTNGENGKWLYTSFLKDGFLGNVSSYGYTDWWSGLWITFYVGIENFRGIALGGHPSREPPENPRGAHCWFIGHADHVKILSV
jgi:hypothetical protein